MKIFVMDLELQIGHNYVTKSTFNYPIKQNYASCTLCVYYVTVSLKYLNQLTSYKVHMTILHKYLLATFKRAITPGLGKQGLQFLCSACCLSLYAL